MCRPEPLVVRNVHAAVWPLPVQKKPRGGLDLAGWHTAVYEISNSNDVVAGDFLPRHMAVQLCVPRAPLQLAMSVRSARSSSRAPKRQSVEAELGEDMQGEADDDDSEDEAEANMWQEVWDVVNWSMSEDEDGDATQAGANARAASRNQEAHSQNDADGVPT